MADHPRALCLDCRHYTITHDARFPHGCRVIGFKGKRLPCQAVEETTGEACQSFEPRPPRSGQGAGRGRSG